MYVVGNLDTEKEIREGLEGECEERAHTVSLYPSHSILSRRTESSFHNTPFYGYQSRFQRQDPGGFRGLVCTGEEVSGVTRSLKRPFDNQLNVED